MTTQDKIAAIIDDLVANKGELDGLVVLASRKDDRLHLRAEVQEGDEADLRVVLAAEILRHLFAPRDTDEQTLEKFEAVSRALMDLKERNNG